MSLAADTREAARAEPFLIEALRAGVVNYAAAARALGISDDYEAVATALRRFAKDLPDRTTAGREVTVTMQSGLGPVESGGLLRVGDDEFGSDTGTLTGILATGDVTPRALSFTLGVFETNAIDPIAAGVGTDTLVVLVERRDGPEALRLVEDALPRVPNSGV